MALRASDGSEMMIRPAPAARAFWAVSSPIGPAPDHDGGAAGLDLRATDGVEGDRGRFHQPCVHVREGIGDRNDPSLRRLDLRGEGTVVGRLLVDTVGLAEDDVTVLGVTGHALGAASAHGTDTAHDPVTGATSATPSPTDRTVPVHSWPNTAGGSMLPSV